MNYSEIRMEARLLLKGHWNKLAVIWLVYFIIIIGLPYLVSSIFDGLDYVASFLIAGPLSLSIVMIILSVYESREYDLGDLFKGFSCYDRAFMANLLVTIYTLLWALLLIVPGIIAAIKYSQVYYIMAEDPHITSADAIKLSTKMMEGNKSDYAMLSLSFIGWALLCALTLGIGLLWLYSYQQMAFMIFYKKVKAKYYQRIVV